MTIPIMHCFDDRYCAPAAVSFLSMLEHAAKDCFYKLYVVNSDISTRHQMMLREVVSQFSNASLEFRSVGDSLVRRLFDSMDTKGHYSKEVLYKMIAPDIFPECSHLVITDVDVLWLDDISKEYRAFVEKDHTNWIAGISWATLPCARIAQAADRCYEDVFTRDEAHVLKTGIGGGYLLFNLDLMRQDGVSKQMLEVFRKYSSRLRQAEQDVINLTCVDRIHRLAPRNMVCAYHYDYLREDEKLQWKDALDNPVQLHYATDVKPWNSPGSTKAHLWWGCLSRTPFFYEVASKFNLNEKKSVCTLGGLRVAKIWHTGTISKACLINSIKTRVREVR